MTGPSVPASRAIWNASFTWFRIWMSPMTIESTPAATLNRWFSTAPSRWVMK